MVEKRKLWSKRNLGRALMVLFGVFALVLTDPRMVWADYVHLTADGFILYTDSAIPAYFTEFLTPPSKKVLDAHKPYRIYQVKKPTL